MLHRYRIVSSYFRRCMPVSVSIRRVRMGNDGWGEAKKIRGKYRITISSSLDDVASVVILLHELAHVLSWEKDTHPSDHGPEFGRAYSKIWRMYLELLDNWPD